MSYEIQYSFSTKILLANHEVGDYQAMRAMRFLKRRSVPIPDPVGTELIAPILA
jgi:hypothetical protein